MTQDFFRVGGAALNQTPLDWQGNKQRIISAIHAAKATRIDLLCLSELTITGYGCEDLFLAPWVLQKAWVTLESLLPETLGITVAIGLPYAHDGIHYNGAALVSNGKLIGIRLKQFLPKDGVHYEPRWFEPWPANTNLLIERDGHQFAIGDVWPTIDIHDRDQAIGFEICEDAWRKERPAVKLANLGVRIILNPSASHFSFGKVHEREAIVQEGSRLVNGLYVYVNQLGNEAGRIIYDGDVIIGLNGKVVCSGPRLTYQDFNLAYVDMDKSLGLISSSHPYLSLPSSKEEEFAAAAALGLFDYLRKSQSKNYVLSLSGGADSSTCAVLVAEMVRRGVKELGYAGFATRLNLTQVIESEQGLVNHLLLTAYQSTQNSGPETYHAAVLLATSIGAKFFNWSVEEAVHQVRSKIEGALGISLDWAQHDIALQNVQARVRSPFIWMLTNITGGLLLTTSNRSEGDVGYATMDGDTSGSLAPIAGVDKTYIRQWLKWAESELGYSGLNAVNNLEPTAELRPAGSGQTDEADLMPYPLMARIERLAIKERLSPAMVYETILQDNQYSPDKLKGYIKRFYQLWSRNQWKRERLAPSFHLDDFNVDPRSWYRFPILSGGFADELDQL